MLSLLRFSSRHAGNRLAVPYTSSRKCDRVRSRFAPMNPLAPRTSIGPCRRLIFPSRLRFAGLRDGISLTLVPYRVKQRWRLAPNRFLHDESVANRTIRTRNHARSSERSDGEPAPSKLTSRTRFVPVHRRPCVPQPPLGAAIFRCFPVGPLVKPVRVIR